VPAPPAVHLVQVAGDGEVWDGVHAPRVLKALACGAPSRQAADGALGGTLKAGASATCTWRARPRGRNRKRLVVLLESIRSRCHLLGSPRVLNHKSLHFERIQSYILH
jgi:hypothetical protein